MKKKVKEELKVALDNFTENERLIMSEIKRLRLCVLIHSIIYYRFNTNLVSDFQYDKFAKKLKKLQDENPKLSQAVPDYLKDFENWDGCSGYNLCLGNEWAVEKAQYLIKTFGETNENQN
jgi:hypothetical protein